MLSGSVYCVRIPYKALYFLVDNLTVKISPQIIFRTLLNEALYVHGKKVGSSVAI